MMGKKNKTQCVGVCAVFMWCSLGGYTVQAFVVTTVSEEVQDTVTICL